MMHTKLLVLNAIAAVSLATIPAQAQSQSANDPLSFVTEEDFLNAMSLFRPPLGIERDGNGFDVVLPNGIEANAQLQNCDDRETSRNCRTLSMIVNLGQPEGRNREELLALVNEFNKRDIHGRTFLNDTDQIIIRWTFFATGHESARGLATKLVNWDAFVRASIVSLYAEEQGN